MRNLVFAALIGTALGFGVAACQTTGPAPKLGALSNPSTTFGYPIPLIFSGGGQLDGGTGTLLTSQVFLTGGQAVSVVGSAACPTTGCSNQGQMQILVSNDQNEFAPVLGPLISQLDGGLTQIGSSADAGWIVANCTTSACAPVSAYVNPAPFGYAEVVVYSSGAQTDGGVFVGAATLGHQ